LGLAPTAGSVVTQRPLTVDVAARQGRELRTRTFRIALPLRVVAGSPGTER
jgi:hypothetical protein